MTADSGLAASLRVEGVESAPGVKDEAKMKRFVVALHEAVTASRA